MSKRATLAERLIRIPLLLMQREWSQQELIREFGVDAVTIRRNLNDLSCFHPIMDDHRRAIGSRRFQLIASNTWKKPKEPLHVRPISTYINS